MRHLVWFAVLATACDPGVERRAVEPKPKPVVAKPDPQPSGDGAGLATIPTWINDPPIVLRDKITALNAHVIVLKAVLEFPEYRDVLAIVEKTPGVVAAEPFIFAELEIASAKHSPVGLMLKAVDPARVARVLSIGPRMKLGTLESLGTGEPPSIILGDDLAKTLSVGIGDRVTVTSPAAAPDKWPATVFRVSGTFHFDFDEYDARLGLAPIAAVQAMFGRGDQVMGIEATVKDLDHSADVVDAILKKLGGPPYVVQDWYELNKRLFTALFGDRRP